MKGDFGRPGVELQRSRGKRRPAPLAARKAEKSRSPFRKAFR